MIQTYYHITDKSKCHKGDWNKFFFGKTSIKINKTKYSALLIPVILSKRQEIFSLRKRAKKPTKTNNIQ